MADTSLQDRLREHADAFDGLLSLIPAKIYYGEETTDQWKRTKQSKEQARAARRGKLDPDSERNRNAKEVMDERARNKRKLEQMHDTPSSGDDISGGEASGGRAGHRKELPGEGLARRESTAKKQKRTDSPQPSTANSARGDTHGGKNLLKRETQAEERRVKAEREEASAPTQETDELSHAASRSTADPGDVAKDHKPNADSTVSEDDGRSATPNSGLYSPIFDTVPANQDGVGQATSTTTSISSTNGLEKRSKHIKVPTDSSALRLRLAAKIESLRAARKANSEDGKPIRTRQELIESRREKQAERKAHKKEMRRQAKAEEERKREEALASSRNSPGGVLSPAAVELGEEGAAANHFAFGRVAFADGTSMSHDLSYAKAGGKKKGATDPKSALAKLTAQRERVAGLDEDKRKEVLEKETWLAARRRAEGAKVHDDEGLLKRTIKRREKAKKKSEMAWRERTKGVQQGIKERQKKREDNIQKRKDQKLLGKAGKKKASKPAKKKNRPGFEGSFGRSSR